jgi:PIN domain nuclease of toxin-antitoxin system
VIVLDTHALLWWVSDSSRLSARAKREVTGAARLNAIAVSAVSLFEIATAVRRDRLALGTALEEWLADLGRIAELRIEPVSAEIAVVAGALTDAIPGDPADRIIVATALALKAKLVTADRKLRKSPHVQSVW